MPVGDYMYADQMNAAIKTAHDKKLFGQMAIYFESCESGSMFENLLKPEWGVYAMSATNSEEGSWAAYCPPSDMIDQVEMNTCLGDWFSARWMEDSDRVHPLNSETLKK